MQTIVICFFFLNFYDVYILKYAVYIVIHCLMSMHWIVIIGID